MTKLRYYSSDTIAAFIFLKNGNYLLFHYIVLGFDLMRIFIVPFIETTTADF